MITAAGFSENTFKLTDPGRLCRGRERWIEPYELDNEPDPIFRGVVSGAQFEDDSARDALRGVQHSGLDFVQVVSSILGDKKLLAFMEDGHPADMPEAADHIEAYTGYRYGGTRNEALVRWMVHLQGHDAIAALLGDDATEDRVRGFVVPKKGHDEEKLMELLFLLTGMSTLDSPPARYQPAALAEVLEEAEMVLLLHRDKHGPAVGVYTSEPFDLHALLQPMAEEAEILLVPFAIPPMLARWDRALSELRGRWDEAASGPFPVPSAPEGYSWEGRRRRRRREKPEVEVAPVEDASIDDDGVLSLGDDGLSMDDLLLVEEDPVEEDEGELLDDDLLEEKELSGDLDGDQLFEVENTDETDVTDDDDGVLELGD